MIHLTFVPNWLPFLIKPEFAKLLYHLNNDLQIANMQFCSKCTCRKHSILELTYAVFQLENKKGEYICVTRL
jgi:hypothetical protein